MRKFITKLPQHKQFNYTPRYYKGKEDINIYDFDSAIKRNRETFSYNNFRAQWFEAREASRHRGNKSLSLRLWLIVFVLLFLFLYIIDFDLTIFLKK